MGKIKLNDILDESSLAYHIENTALGIIVFDKDLKVTYWSDKAAEIFKWPASEILHKPVMSLKMIYEEDIEKVATIIEEILSGSISSNHSTNRNYTKTGSIIYCDWFNSALKDSTGNISSVISFILNVTEQEDAFQKLVNREDQLSLIYNSSIDPIWLIDIEGPDQFRFVNINDSFTHVTGLTLEQVVGLKIEEVLPASSHELVRQKYNEAINSGKVIDYVEVALHPAGERVGEIRVIPVKNALGIVTKIVGIAHDITEERAMQKKFDQERDELNKMIMAAAIKGQELERNYIGRELHDNVNQVLTTVKLYTELCSSGSVDIAEFLPRCTQLLTDTINEIRHLSKRLSPPSLSSMGFMEVLEDLVLSVQETKSIDITLNIDSPSSKAMGPELRLAIYRITQEQLTNILKHANADKVTITLEYKEEQIILCITDDGVGFDTSLKVQGIGITNMTSRAHLLNGSLKMISSRGEGCMLIATFPVTFQKDVGPPDGSF